MSLYVFIQQALIFDEYETKIAQVIINHQNERLYDEVKSSKYIAKKQTLQFLNLFCWIIK